MGLPSHLLWFKEEGWRDLERWSEEAEESVHVSEQPSHYNKNNHHGGCSLLTTHYGPDIFGWRHWGFER